jgi:histidinol phosphatase-like PHP family hydrolase
VHSEFSKGKNSIKQISKHAINNDLTLGIADQYSWHEYKKSKITRGINQYLLELEVINRGNNNILRGIEIDTTSIHRFTYLEQFLDKLDYVLFEHVIDLAGNYSYDPKRRNRTIDHLKEIIHFKKETGLTVGLSRPDFSLVQNQAILHSSLDMIEKAGIAVELNETYGNYYTPTFTEEILSREIILFCGTSSKILERMGKFYLVNAFVSRFQDIENKLLDIQF